jgi:hypothetical protein
MSNDLILTFQTPVILCTFLSHVHLIETNFINVRDHDDEFFSISTNDRIYIFTYAVVKVVFNFVFPGVVGEGFSKHASADGRIRLLAI